MIKNKHFYLPLQVLHLEWLALLNVSYTLCVLSLHNVFLFLPLRFFERMATFAKAASSMTEFES